MHRTRLELTLALALCAGPLFAEEPPATATPATPTPPTPVLGWSMAKVPAISGPLWSDAQPPDRPRRGGAPAPTLTMQSFVKLARTLGPAVVNISTIVSGDRDIGIGVGAPSSSPHRRSRAQGTGFIIHRSGLILTNNHVVDGTEQIKVRLADERELMARVVGRDDHTDLALIKIESPTPLPVAPLGDSDKVEIGEWVVAIGNPLGLDHTVTAGIVSAKGRRDVKPGGSTDGFYDFIQTDASINAGNSGGPLINSRGEVIGINTAMNERARGIAFAIPVNMAKAIVPLLNAHGRAPRSSLGLQAQSVTAMLKRGFGLSDTRGALVSEVTPKSPAALAGVLPGDVVLEYDGHPIRRSDDLQWLVATTAAGRKVSLTLLRGPSPPQKLTVSATLVPALEEAAARPTPPPTPAHASALGMTVSEVTTMIARELKQPGLRGLVVMSVEPESPAAEAGVEQADVLLRVSDTDVANIEDYSKAMRTIPRGEVIKLLVRRDGHNLWIAFPKR